LREHGLDAPARAAAGASSEPQYMEADIVGALKYWRDAKGYGAIASDAPGGRPGPGPLVGRAARRPLRARVAQRDDGERLRE